MPYYLRAKHHLNSFVVFGREPLPGGTFRKNGYYLETHIKSSFASFPTHDQAQMVCRILNAENPDRNLDVIEGDEFWAKRGTAICQMIVLPHGGSPRAHFWLNGETSSVNLDFSQVDCIQQCLAEWYHTKSTGR